MTAPTTKREKKTSFCSTNTETTLLPENYDQTSTVPSTLYPRRRYSSTSSWSSYSQGLKRCENKIAAFHRLKFWFVVACVINVFFMTGIVTILYLYVQEIIKVFNVDSVLPTTTATVGTVLPPREEYPESDIEKYLNCSTHDGYYRQCYLSELAEDIQKSIEDVRLSKALEKCAKRPYIHVQKGELSKSASNDLHVMKWNDIEHDGFNSRSLTEDGTVKVEEDGFYFLYTQVHFVVNTSTTMAVNESSAGISGMHIVEKKGIQDIKFTVIVNSTFQCSLENDLQQQHTSSLKRIVQAKQNEEIRVVIKYPIEQFETKPLQNYFGMFKLC